MDSLAVLLLPGRLEAFDRAADARRLLEIPRVIALEASRFRAPWFLRDAAPLRAARKLRFPGEIRVIVLYAPDQYPLARALRGRFADAELWYLPPAGSVTDAAGRRDLDELARHHAHTVLEDQSGRVDGEPLRARLGEVGVIDARAFLPGDPRSWPKPERRRLR